MVGCSNKTEPSINSANENKSDSEDAGISKVDENIASDKSSLKNNQEATNSENNLKDEDSQKTLVDSIIKLAKQGKIINSDFPVKSTSIQDVEGKLGNSDTSEFVSEAKGSYYTFSKDNVAFGCNKATKFLKLDHLIVIW